MFEPTGLGKKIFEQRYARFEGETWAQASERVAEHVAQAEENGKVQKYGQRFKEELVTNRFMPGGRIWYGSGRPKAQLLNCFVIPAEDSREGWGKVFYDVTVISGLGGGVGINFSPVRGRGFPIKGTGGVATGAVSVMHVVNSIGQVIQDGGGRRTALMLDLNIDHPDLEEFLNAKLDRNQLTNANISVVLNFSADEFTRKVREKTEIELCFNGRGTGRFINAAKLWDTIVTNAWKNGEPGVLNGYEANRLNNIWYHKPLISTNPCGEIWLEQYGCCDLGALVLPRFVRDGEMDWDQLDQTVRLGIRFLDDVLTVNHYPLPEIKENCEQVRRIGLGVMGLHSMLLELGFKYSSDEGRKFIDHLFSFIKNTAYDASVTLAAEKGPFPAYDLRFLDGEFIKTLKRGIRNKIREHGIRNCAMLTIAPTGTTAMVAGVSSGIEPLLAPVYYRHYYVAEKDATRRLEKELVVTNEFEKFPDLVEGAYDLTPRQHFQMQSIVQRHIDNAVSKTINLPKDYPVEELGDVWLEFLGSIKGSTFYREGSREFEPLEPVRMEDVGLVLREAKSMVSTESNYEELGAMDCPDGICELPVEHPARELASVV